MDTIASLFSGGKLYDVGAMTAGLRPLWGVEYDPRIAAVAELNVPAPCLVARVEEVDYSTLETPWLLHMSPVCKNASQAKTDAGEQPEDIEMAAGCIRAIEALRPRCITLENVWGYRTFEAFKNILKALKGAGYAVGYWHLNSADYGVPQTRKRLILIASLDFQPVKPAPTHRKGGDMWHLPWVGWYEAIADLIPSLPETKPAAWQLERLPADIKNNLLLSPAMSQGYEIVTRSPEEPSITICAADENQLPVRALLFDGRNTNQEWGKLYRSGDEPRFVACADSHMPSALLVGGQYQNPNTSAERTVQHAAGASPSWTVTPGSAKDTRAFLMQGTSTLELRTADEPSAVCVATVGAKAAPPKAFIGRWVKMTIHALGRFQTVPDSYQGLTAEINGNGVPCLLAQRIVESAIEQDQRRKLRAA